MTKLPATLQKKSVARLTPLQLYLQEIAKYPLLTPDEEFDLAQKHFEDQDRETAHRLITSNLRLVVKIATDFYRAKNNLLDLIQEGNYGLMQAVKKFNPYKGVKLSSYAAWWIRAYILKYLMDHRSQIKLATTAAQRKLFYNLQKETELLLLENPNEAFDPKIIADKLNVPEKEVLEMQKRMASSQISLDAPYYTGHDEGSKMSRGELIHDERLASFDDLLADNQINDLFAKHLEEFQKTLKGRDLEIFKIRLLSDEPQTLQAIGDKYGITRERARQIEARILTRLKEFVLEKGDIV